METEYIRSLHSNYQRFMLDEKPEEKKYQYCMVNRGGIKGLLSCSLRYLNGDAYLYYDITSKQNIAQLFQKELIQREWMRDFLLGMRHLKLELGRFLLQDSNVLWEPEQIFQDLERNEFSFIYYPYYKGENHFLELLSFFVEHIDYEDELLVECVYRMYEQYEKNGDAYLQENIYRDMEILYGKSKKATNVSQDESDDEHYISDDTEEEKEYIYNPYPREKTAEAVNETDKTVQEKKDIHSETNSTRKSFLSFFDTKRNRQREKEARDEYHLTTMQQMEGFAVAEQVHFEEAESLQSGFGQTVYLDADREEQMVVHRIYNKSGSIVAKIDSPSMLIGKSKEKVDLYLDDISVSRMHAKVIRKNEETMLEDLNSTNGTFVNGKRMQPYENRRLEPGDEIKCGNVTMYYR